LNIYSSKLRNPISGYSRGRRYGVSCEALRVYYSVVFP